MDGTRGRRAFADVRFFHGNGADRRAFAETGEPFHHRGWGVVLASYPGYSGNPGEPSEASEGRAAALVLESPYTSMPDLCVIPVCSLATDRFDTLSLVPRINVPVLISHDENDPVIPFAMGRKLADLLGERANFVPIPKLASHYPHQDMDLTDTVELWMREKHIE
jgi:hypothetical protein